MKKLAFVFAAIAVAAMTGANAQELGVRVEGDRDMYGNVIFAPHARSLRMANMTAAFVVGVLVPRAGRWAGEVLGALPAFGSRAAADAREAGADVLEVTGSVKVGSRWRLFATRSGRGAAAAELPNLNLCIGQCPSTSV